MTKISKIYAPRQQITLTGEEAELILSLRVVLEKKLGKISLTNVVRIALKQLAETELLEQEVLQTDERTISPSSE